VRKALVAGAQVVAGLTLTVLFLLGKITEVPYTVFAVLFGTGPVVDGCRNLHALRTSGGDNPREP